MAFFKKLMEKFKFGNTLYYPGCMSKYALPVIERNYRDILGKIGIDFITIPDDEVCCGSPVLKAGYREDFENLRKKNLETFKKYGVTKIITSCPTCAYMFRKYYGIEAEHITQTIWRHIKKFQPNMYNEEVCYHDPCHLGRYMGVYNEPRKILEYLGFKVKELKNNKESSLCCGGGGGLKSNYKKLSQDIAKIRLEQCSAKKLITPCPMCYSHLKENSKEIKVMEFSEVLTSLM